MDLNKKLIGMNDGEEQPTTLQNRFMKTYIKYYNQIIINDKYITECLIYKTELDKNNDDQLLELKKVKLLNGIMSLVEKVI